MYSIRGGMWSVSYQMMRLSRAGVPSMSNIRWIWVSGWMSKSYLPLIMSVGIVTRVTKLMSLVSGRPRGSDAWHELHHQEIRAVLRVEVEDCCDAGVFELRQGESFAAEPLTCRIVIESAGEQDLDGDVALEMLVAGAIDDAHAARTDSLNDAEVRQRSPGETGVVHNASGLKGRPLDNGYLPPRGG
jgi:hypothetical protein